MTIDRAAIRAALARRNALRRASNLPLLDVRIEYTREVALAEWRHYRQLCDLRAREREAIRQAVVEELREKHRRDFRLSMGGRWMIEVLAQRQFVALLNEKYGIRPPESDPTRHVVRYGGARKPSTP